MQACAFTMLNFEILFIGKDCAMIFEDGVDESKFSELFEETFCA